MMKPRPPNKINRGRRTRFQQKLKITFKVYMSVEDTQKKRIHDKISLSDGHT